MADRVLRDHSEPCKDLGRFKESNGVWGCDEHGCPGGREVIIDPLIEAAEAVVSALEGSDFWGLGVVADLQTALTALGEG